MIRTRKGKLLVACGVVVFLAISGLLARWLALENIERDDIVTLLQAEARGDANAMLAQLHGCDRYCRANVVRVARRVKRPGSVLILADQSQTAYSLTSTVGDTRVAWKATSSRLPVVQCVRVERTGNVLSGLVIRLLAVSVPIPDTADC
jgi:hypothetical protein